MALPILIECTGKGEKIFSPLLPTGTSIQPNPAPIHPTRRHVRYVHPACPAPSGARRCRTPTNDNELHNVHRHPNPVSNCGTGRVRMRNVLSGRHNHNCNCQLPQQDFSDTLTEKKSTPCMGRKIAQCRTIVQMYLSSYTCNFHSYNLSQNNTISYQINRCFY